MSNEQPTSLPPQVQRDMPVHCAKCGAFNERAALVCSACRSELRFKCRHCQALNLRTTSRCSKCHRILRFAVLDLSVFKLNFKRRRWTRGWWKRRFDRWAWLALFLLLGGLLLCMLSSTLGVSAPPP